MKSDKLFIIWEVGNKIPNHDAYIITQDFNKLTTETKKKIKTSWFGERKWFW